jgi:hypothetical protein
MRVTFLAALAAVLLGCRQPSAPEIEEQLDQAAPASATVPGRYIGEEVPEEHQGC